MNSRSAVVWVIAVLGTVSEGTAQSVAIDRFTMSWGWNDNATTMMLGGASGPEDIAYNAVTGTLFVSHDIPGMPTDILLEYDLSGTLLQGNVLLAGVGGLCAHPNGQLLSASGATIVEVDALGAPVIGGINMVVAGYGNIQDLDFDVQGRLWIHDGNSGDFSTVDLVSGLRTPRFVLPFGAQGFCIRSDNGNILLATAFFNAGATIGELVEVTQAGQIVVTGLNATVPHLIDNRDPCAPAQGTFQVVTGMSWIPGLEMLAVASFLPANGFNVALFAPVGTAFIGRVGDDGVRADGQTFRIDVVGDAVIGTAGCVITVENADPGTLWVLAHSYFRDCSEPFIGPSSRLMVVPAAPYGGILIQATLTSTIVRPILLFGAPAVLAGIDVWVQVVGQDLSDPMLSLIATACLRLHLG